MDANSPNAWTIAYRKRTANRFQRVTNWTGTWQEAFDMARVFSALHPDLQVYYVSSRAHEDHERVELPRQVASGEMGQHLADAYLVDHGNILVDSGKRVRMTETGTLDPELLPKDDATWTVQPVPAQDVRPGMTFHPAPGHAGTVRSVGKTVNGFVLIYVGRDPVPFRRTPGELVVVSVLDTSALAATG
jgi:hypothetical protein